MRDNASNARLELLESAGCDAEVATLTRYAIVNEELRLMNCHDMTRHSWPRSCPWKSMSPSCSEYEGDSC